MPRASVSIHAPAWGATLLQILTFAKLGFQSTHPHGVRLRLIALLSKPYVSIHAPAWGATKSSLVYKTDVGCFNPRTRMGCDSHAQGRLRVDSCFNPRTRMGCDKAVITVNDTTIIVSIHAPAWGATQSRSATLEKARGFNPRTRMGCD